MSRVFIISFSPIKSDARVLRQLNWLKDAHQLTVFGYGDKPMEGIEFVPLPMKSSIRDVGVLMNLIGGMHKWVHDYQFRIPEISRALFEAACRTRPALIVVNDIDPMPAVVRIFRKPEFLTPIMLDLHEFAPLELEDDFRWRALFGRHRQHICRKYIPFADTVTTVTDSFIPLYGEYLSETQKISTILNCPEASDSIEFRQTNPSDIRIVHHGGASPQRRLENLIEAVKKSEERFSLHFYLIGGSPRMQSYHEFLKRSAGSLLDKRVFFHEPVEPHQIVKTLAKFDMGFYPMPASSINTRHAMPNKLFDFIHAGLCVVISPNPDMATIVRDRKCGVIVPSSDIQKSARILNRLTAGEIDEFKKNSIETAKSYSAALEGAKFMRIASEILGRL